MPIMQADLTKTEIRISPYEADPRFAYAWHSTARVAGAPLLVAVHGSDRDYVPTIEAFLALADAVPMSVIAPHFPIGAGEPGYGDGYKFLAEAGVDYVAVLLGMIEQFNRQVVATAPEFYLFGFSGGAQFVHRFAYFEASRLSGLVVSAPGAVTLPDPDIEWWPGLTGAEAAIGRPPDLAALLQVPVAITVGNQDVATGLVRRAPSERNGSVHAELAGGTRVDRAESLHNHLVRMGVESQFIRIGGAGHELAANASAACDILGGWLAAPTHFTPTDKG